MEDLENSFYANSSSNSSDCKYHARATLYRQIAGGFVFIVIWPLIVMDFARFPIGRTAAALLGAVLMVVFNVINQPQVFRTLGESDNLQTIFLLVGMMIISYYFDREGVLTIISVKMFGKSLSLRKILWKVCLLSAVLSAFITNDAACLLIAPLVLNMYAKKSTGNIAKELLPLSLGIATSANIGGAATVFGNPQNVLIAAKSDNVTLSHFLIAELPTAILALLINIGLLHLIFCRVVFHNDDAPTADDQEQLVIDSESQSPAPSIRESRSQRYGQFDRSRNPSETSLIATERENRYASFQTKNTDGTVPIPTYMAGVAQHRQQSIMVTSTRVADIGPAETLTISVNNVTPVWKRSTPEKLFIVWLFLISAVVLITLAINVPSLKKRGVSFNLGLMPIAAAVFTMLVDSILNRKYQHDSMAKIDWPVILMFMGLFVWIEGFKTTCIPNIIFNALKKQMNLTKPLGVIVFTIFIVIGSNIFSNVPLVIIIVDHLDEFCGDGKCQNEVVGPLLLAWVSTIAGNLTLIGSIANLIVAEKAKKSDAKYNLSFLRYLPYGLISTAVITIITVPCVYGLACLASKIISQ